MRLHARSQQNQAVATTLFFLFGDVGLGKTHLLSAIGHTIQANHPDAKIVYQSSESFANEVVDAVLNGKLEEFRRKYREETDVLLMDDIQLLAGKERTQHELFHIFNVMYDSNRQIVLTSDKLPHDLPNVEDRLEAVFNGASSPIFNLQKSRPVSLL